ncbi:hypothetical protein [Niastella vici]|uniref:hypothetical protein n=1 Tax=Niastella vici TaxID=1703345 RepID=UPI00117C65FE|nr:hypothetical protein [Niastella vici]
MVKIKWAFISMAIIFAVFGAFATKPQASCDSQTQYFQFAGSYYPAGTYGVDYTCLSGPGTCTWYNPNPYNPNSFSPCKTGTFQFVFLNK